MQEDTLNVQNGKYFANFVLQQDYKKLKMFVQNAMELVFEKIKLSFKRKGKKEKYFFPLIANFINEFNDFFYEYIPPPFNDSDSGKHSDKKKKIFR